MRPLLAIVKLTWKAAFRYRLFWVLAALLLGAVIGLPAVVEDDGTAKGLVQIVLTYTLGTVIALLGFATLWLSCGTLARDIEECQVQMIAVKPVPRWQVWIGKWLGIMSLNAVLLLLGGGCIFGLLVWRATKLEPDQLQILRNEVLVARGSLKEPALNYQPQVEEEYKAQLRARPVAPEDRPFLKRQIEEMIKAKSQVVPSRQLRQWKIDASGIQDKLGEDPLFIRARFYTANLQPGRTLVGTWRFGVPETPRIPDVELSMAPETYYEFPVSSRAIREDGMLIVNFMNYNDEPVLFLLDEDLEVLYRESSFGVNFARGLGVILCWLGLLSAIGLAASSFLSFPVAAFFSLALMIVALFSGTMAASIEEGTIMGVNHETGQADHPYVDRVMLPVFKGLLAVINLAKGFSPVDALSSGRSISWGSLGLAWLQIVGFFGGVFALIGIVVFTRRELATAQGAS